MFEALVITLREGVEAALVLGIALALLRRRGLESLRGALLAGAALALAASVGVAFLARRITWNEEIAEGVTMLVGGVLVLTLTWWMWRAAPRMKEEVESGLARGAGGGAWGVFLFAFGMVFREGAETAVFLSAAGFNTQGLGLWTGAAIGLALALGFGVLFVRGSIRVPLKPFFSVTTAVLLLLAVQLVVGGLHELSEGGVLPASRQEMAIVGPLVKNELLLFTLTVALAAAWLLFGPRSTPAPAATAAAGPEARLALAARRREESRRRWTGLVALAIVALLSTAFVRSSRVPDRPPAAAVAAENGGYAIDPAPLSDLHLHFYQATLDGREVRFFAVRVQDRVVTCLDGCEICGDIGYYEDGASVICRNCTSPIVKATIGRHGGCNPIPLANTLAGGRLRVAETDLRAALGTIRER